MLPSEIIAGHLVFVLEMLKTNVIVKLNCTVYEIANSTKVQSEKH